MNKKEFINYETPEVEIFEVESEGIWCGSQIVEGAIPDVGEGDDVFGN